MCGACTLCAWVFAPGVNERWEHVFQRLPADPPDKLQRLICRGKHGLILAYSWAAHYATVVGRDEKDLVQMRVQQLPTKLRAILIPGIRRTPILNCYEGMAEIGAGRSLKVNMIWI
ncbi:hypothetical protein C8F04DRAFT_1176457 [Mycena alexandri]|uniref:Uncharacterized protein n=1 Tax=Mycena alexandri TaxID=1745969 RepID=A0AAD6TB02_9AGAR|nr:hypothetical protein C8F04DRAFT_1176457 [Mycena alexandri]